MISTEVATWILFSSFILLLIIRVPVALALVCSSVFTGLYMHIPLEVIGQKMLNGLNSFSLLAIPLFILAGEIMGEGGMSKRLIEMSNLFVGRFRGGLAMVNVVACMFFGGITGSAVADASSIGSLMIPMMTKKGYDKDYSVAVTVTGSIQGVVVPPSHNVILYALAAGGVSISSLFMAGIIPGVVLCLALMFSSYVIAVKRGYPKGEPVPKQLWGKILIQGCLSLTTALIIIGGIIGGIFTANESASIAVVYALVLVMFVFREMKPKSVLVVFTETFRKLSVVLFLISASAAFAFFLSILQIPNHVLEAMTQASSNKFVILILINVILLVLGCIMDMAPLILIATPVLLPVVLQLGMDPVQFGIMLMLNLGIGLLTPPVGAVLFVGCSIGGITMEKVTKAMLPFIATMAVVLLCITFIPSITMFLPHLFGK
jgi:tripartite ATP-independent transporter DctM subunit